MNDDSSFSSIGSTISYHTARGRSFSSTSMEDFESDISSASSEIVPCLWDESLTSTDSNIDNRSDVIAEELAKSQTCLYDIKIEISMEVPKEETFNKPDMLRATVFTISGDIVFKNKEWTSLGSLIAHQLGKAMDPTTCTWEHQDKYLLFHEKYKISGHYHQSNDFLNSSIVFDKIKFNGSICATSVKLHYTIEVFITPVVAGAEMFYRIHGFDTVIHNYDYKGKHLKNILEAHKEEKLKSYDHHLAWATVYNVLEEYRQCIAKENEFMTEYGLRF